MIFSIKQLSYFNSFNKIFLFHEIKFQKKKFIICSLKSILILFIKKK